MSSPILYILYNADASLMGKLRYGYRKIRTSTEDNPACAACDMTHGGLSLTETSGWVKTKKDIETEINGVVVQWHRDELNKEVGDFMKNEGARFPAAVLKSGDGKLSLVMKSTELAECAGDPQAFLKELKSRGIVPAQSSSL